MITRRQFLRGRFGTAAATTATPTAARSSLAEIGPTCIAIAQNVVCRSCGDVCDAAAIRFTPRLGGAAIPLVLLEQCSGCGDCLAACPAGAIHLAPRPAASEKPRE